MLSFLPVTWQKKLGKGGKLFLFFFLRTKNVSRRYAKAAYFVLNGNSCLMFQNLICRPVVKSCLCKTLYHLSNVLQRLQLSNAVRSIGESGTIQVKQKHVDKLSQQSKQKDKVLVGYLSSWIRMPLLGCRFSFPFNIKSSVLPVTTLSVFPPRIVSMLNFSFIHIGYHTSRYAIYGRPLQMDGD